MLNSTENAQIASITQREGGWDSFIQQALAAVVAERKQAALTALQGSMTLTITDRAKVAGIFNAAAQNRLVLREALSDLLAAWQSGDDSQLAARLVLVAAAAKGHLGL